MDREFLYSGGAYVLGRTGDAYAVWKVGAHAGEPLQTYPLDDAGWGRSYTALMKLDPAARVLTPQQLAYLNDTAAASVVVPPPPPPTPVTPSPSTGSAVRPGPVSPATGSFTPVMIAGTHAGGLTAVTGEPNGLGTAGGVLGIVGTVGSLIPFFGIFIGIPLGILAVVFGGVGMSKAGRTGTGRGMAVTGLVLGILTIIFKLIPGVNLL